MKLLLYTHALIWHSDSSPQMSTTATTLLNDPANDLFLSMASAWEIAIKAGLKKRKLAVPYIPFMTTAMAVYQVSLLPVSVDDCTYYEQLPFPNPNHRDPFDRMIITHSFRNGLSIVGNDAAFDSYGVTRFW